MPTYLTLLRFTDQGIRTIKESPSRIDAARRAFQAAGGDMKQWYLTFGRYDAVVISEAPSDEAMARITAGIVSQGAVRTETTRMFTESEYRKMISELK